MKSMTVANLKSHFSEVLKEVQNGEEIVIEYGRSHQKLGVIIPYQNYQRKKRKIGILDGKASFSLSKDFKMSTEELLSL